MNHCLYLPVLQYLYRYQSTSSALWQLFSPHFLGREGQLLAFCKQQILRNREIEVQVYKMHLSTATAAWHRTSLLGAWLLCKIYIFRFECALPIITQGASRRRQN